MNFLMTVNASRAQINKMLPKLKVQKTKKVVEGAQQYVYVATLLEHYVPYK